MKKVILALILAFGCTAVSEHAIPTVRFSAFECMVANIFFEARGEGTEGMKAIAAVTMNRVKSSKYPSSVCKVVFQSKQFSWTYQQPLLAIQKVMLGGIALSDKDAEAYLLAMKIAHSAINGKLKHAVKGSLWYHSQHANPAWKSKMKLQAKIGNHLFYKEG